MSAPPTTAVLDGLDDIMASLEDLYRDVHAHPELSMQEHRTAGKAAERLQAAGFGQRTRLQAIAHVRIDDVTRR